jgi:hypothetical protein
MTRTICPKCGKPASVTTDNRLGNHPGRGSALRCDFTTQPVTTPTFEGARRPTPAELAAERFREREAQRLEREKQIAEEKARMAAWARRADLKPMRRDEGYAYPRIHVVSGGLPGHGRRR